MSHQLASEWRKVTTTRTAWGILAGLVALIALGSIGIMTHAPKAELSRPLVSQDLLGVPMFALTVFALVLGLRSFTDEFRHGSIVPTLLASPHRRRVLAAKLVVMAGMGILFSVVAGAASLSLALIGLSIKGVHVSASASALGAWGVKLVLVGLLWSLMGVGVGLAVKHQVAAIVGSLVWIMIGENLLSALFPKVAKYLPAMAGRAIHASEPGSLGHVEGALVLTAWVVLVIIVGDQLMQRRDIA